MGIRRNNKHNIISTRYKTKDILIEVKNKVKMSSLLFNMVW